MSDVAAYSAGAPAGQRGVRRLHRGLIGIDAQVTKAENAVAGKVPVKRNRFITLKGADKTVNRDDTGHGSPMLPRPATQP